MNVDDTLFTLHINPYFLRLNFSHALLEDDSSSATYDGGTGYLTVVLTKQTRGQEFRDLDLLAKLLAPRPSSNEVKIEVLDSSPEEDDDLVAKTQALSIEPDVLEGSPCTSTSWECVDDFYQRLKMIGRYLRLFLTFYLPCIFQNLTGF